MPTSIATSGVRRFIDESIEGARERGFAQTLLGRRRYLPDLASRNRTLRSAAERMAVNSALQGTAADLIKKAMVELDRALPDAGLGARMILQVHDELVFEVAPAEIDALTELVRDRMEGVLPLRVPLSRGCGCRGELAGGPLSDPPGPESANTRG